MRESLSRASSSTSSPCLADYLTKLTTGLGYFRTNHPPPMPVHSIPFGDGRYARSGEPWVVDIPIGSVSLADMLVSYGIYTPS